jgi:hypothetical protein
MPRTVEWVGIAEILGIAVGVKQGGLAGRRLKMEEGDAFPLAGGKPDDLRRIRGVGG